MTRPGDGPGRLGELLQSRGASVVHWPCIRFDPPEDPEPLRAAAGRPAFYDWLVITSPRAARRWLAVAEATAGSPSRDRPRVAVAGPGTADVLRGAGWRVDRIPDEYSARGLVAAFEDASDVSGARVLFPCSDRAGAELPDGLRRLGAHVDRVVAYRTVPTPPEPEEVLEAASSGRVGVVTFTSPSTVEGFLSELRGTARAAVVGRLRSAAIGPTTAEALDRNRWPPVVAAEATLEALAAVAVEAASDGSRTHGAKEVSG
ncbi:MAG: uroporphyrinogen-III synthase [Gemmatimonadota bacterium]